MKDSFRQQFERLALRLAELEATLADPRVAADMKRFRELTREHAEVSAVAQRYRHFCQREQDLAEARALLDDPDMADMAGEEVAAVEAELPTLEAELQALLLPRDPDDARNTFLEVRAGTGGDEAALFAGDLLRMYTRYAATQGWRVEVMSAAESELGGYKEVVLRVAGDNAYGKLRYESGGHRVQRVPATEAQGRIHTSAATVAVLPEAEEVDIELKSDEVRIEVCRSSGAGGQGVNTTDSAVQVLHIPTGTIVRCQDGRSQIKNKEKALSILRSRLLEKKQQEEAAKYSANRRNLIGSGGREEKIRTYNYPQNRVTDHRIEMTLYNLDQFVQGKIEPMQQALLAADLQERLAEAGLR